MRLTEIQVAGLRVAVADADAVPSQEKALAGRQRLAFIMGKMYGRADLARELLAEATDRGAQIHRDGWRAAGIQHVPINNPGISGMDCKAAERPGACTCDACADYRGRL